MTRLLAEWGSVADWAAAAFGGGALITAIFAILKSNHSNRIAEAAKEEAIKANTLSAQSNEIAEGSRQEASAANTLSHKANELSEAANTLSQRLLGLAEAEHKPSYTATLQLPEKPEDSYLRIRITNTGVLPLRFQGHLVSLHPPVKDPPIGMYMEGDVSNDGHVPVLQPHATMILRLCDSTKGLTGYGMIDAVSFADSSVWPTFGAIEVTLSGVTRGIDGGALRQWLTDNKLPRKR